MKYRRLHRLLGLVLLLPFVAWATTAIFFLVRPGYADAYAALDLATSNLPATIEVSSEPEWREFRYASSPLGEHLLVRTRNGWQHLDGRTGAPFPPPGEADLRHLLETAIAANPDRYGQLTSIDGLSAQTSTDVEITVHWNNLTASQMGRDTRWINKVYDIHYLRWTGHAGFDQVFGVAGLILLLVLTWTGATLALRGKLPWKSSARNVPETAI